MLMMSFYRNFFVRNFFARCVIGFLFVGLCFVIVPLMVSGAKAQSSQVETLDRIEALEEGMKQVRGTLEENLHALTQSVEGNQGLSQGDTAALQQQFLNLSEQIERTLEIASANEARLLRLEKRLESLAQAWCCWRACKYGKRGDTDIKPDITARPVGPMGNRR